VSVALASFFVLAGCASTKVSDREEYEGARLPRPGRILVYDFAVTETDVPEWSEARRAYSEREAEADSGRSTPMTAEELAAGRKLGASVARELIEKIGTMGLHAVQAEGQGQPELNDIVLIGYFTAIDSGSTAKRLLIGFGTGTASVGVHAEGYRMTEGGLVKLGSGQVDSGGGGKAPGVVVPVLVTIATANPIGLVVGGVVKAEGEISGRTTAKGSAKRIANEIADVLEEKFEQQGWK